MKVTQSEKEHDDVYGRTFAAYGAKEMREFIGFFEQRFAANAIDPRSLFAGKSVLDAGCGNGRGAIFAAMNGAASISGIDVSPNNIESTRSNLAAVGFKDAKIEQGTLEALPHADETFDVVWCNGVLMHAANPDACLKEITRVLKVGGRAWIYVYGAGGIYWYFVRAFREINKSISAERCIELLKLMRYETRYIAEYLDDWKVSNLRTYTATDFSSRLAALGYQSPAHLPHGVEYDTSQRISTRPAEREWWGEGDLRYLVTREKSERTEASVLSATPDGSAYDFPASIKNQFGGKLDQLKVAVKGNDVLAVAACAYVQWHLRAIMSRNAPLSISEIDAVLDDAIRIVSTK